MVSCLAPFTAEDAWERLGHTPSVAEQPWPQADPALFAGGKVTCVVQIDGKVRARIEVPPEVEADDLKTLVLSSPVVQNALNGTGVGRLIVRPPGPGEHRAGALSFVRQAWTRSRGGFNRPTGNQIADVE
jgi:leucyl-tRNA synthetase